MRVILFAFLSVLPKLLFGQNTISGTVIDKSTQEPLPSATVYINGTTKGCITDAEGRFTLKDVIYPATIIASFIGYQPIALSLSANAGELNFKLEPNTQLPEVKVYGKSERDEYLKNFKNKFLGEDTWGRKAIIKNDEVLMFSNEIVTETEKETTVFRAWANEPIIIDLPLLGYEVHVILDDFYACVTEGHTVCGSFGYYYYKPYETSDQKKTDRYAKNRRRVYYNSRQHFLRSWYENSLAENGYKVVTEHDHQPIDLYQYSDRTDDDSMMAHGLMNQHFVILYRHKSDGSPKPIENKNMGFSYYISGISFAQDTCVFTRQGMVLNESIRFMGDIGDKRIGSCLPQDYVP